MNPESSPFRPGQPAPVEFFVGRRAEIERVRAMVRASARGRVGIGFVSGERGIGKSSLARFVRHLVEQNDGAVGCHVFLGGVQDPEIQGGYRFPNRLYGLYFRMSTVGGNEQ